MQPTTINWWLVRERYVKVQVAAPGDGSLKLEANNNDDDDNENECAIIIFRSEMSSAKSSVKLNRHCHFGYVMLKHHTIVCVCL